MKWYIYLVALFLLFFYMFLQSIIYKTRYYKLSTNIGLRFLHLTDIHIKLLCVSPGRVKRTINKVNPDYMLIGGDLLDKPQDLIKFVHWFSKLNLQIPVYAVMGNHEHKAFKYYPQFKDIFLSEMKKLNIRVLSNEIVLVGGKSEHGADVPESTVALIGIDDYKTGDIVNNNIFNGLRDKCNCILAFSHNPDVALHIPEGSVDILITGHYHGGQIWMPFNLEYTLLRKDQLSKMGYTKGLSVIRGNKVYISRGLGTVLFPFRFLSVPEVTVFDV
jgi:predicted MPP superfamily phosphohydrolase